MKNIDKGLVYIWKLANLSQELGVLSIYHDIASNYPHWAKQVQKMNQLETPVERTLWKICQRKIGATEPQAISAILGVTDDLICIIDFESCCDRENAALYEELEHERSEHNALMDEWGLRFDRSGSVLSGADQAFAEYQRNVSTVRCEYQRLAGRAHLQLNDIYYRSVDNFTSKTAPLARSRALHSAMRLRSEVMPKGYRDCVKEDNSLRQLEECIHNMQSMHQKYAATIIDIGNKFSNFFQYA